MSKAKLCQIVAVVSGQKTNAQKVLTDAHLRLKPDSLTGLYRRYEPFEDGQANHLPPEIKRVQNTIPNVLSEVKSALAPMLDVVLTQDIGNTIAKADIKVDGKVVLSGVPVTNLLFLEKQVTDLETFIAKLPTLDPSENWKPDPEIGGYTTDPYVTQKLAKVAEVLELAKATDKHPAQVQVQHVDKPIGVWNNTKKSGAIRIQDRNNALKRVRALKDAIKVAREEANSIEVEQKKCGDAVLGFVFGDLVK